MRFKAFLYISIITLAVAVGGALSSIIFGIETGRSITSYAMSVTQTAGLALLVLNSRIVYQHKILSYMGIAAMLPLIGYFLIIYSSIVGLTLQLAGLIAIVTIYSLWFINKKEKNTLDYLKEIWICSKVGVSAFSVLNLPNARDISHFSNIFFYTMLIYFIWSSLNSIKKQEISESLDERSLG